MTAIDAETEWGTLGDSAMGAVDIPDDPFVQDEPFDTGKFLLDKLAFFQESKARLDAMAVTVTRMLVELVGENAVDALRTSRERPPTELQEAHERVDARAALADEITVALGMQKGAARDLVEFAAAPVERTQPLLDDLTDGDTTWEHCRTALRATCDLTDRQAVEATTAALQPARGGGRVSWDNFRSRLRRQVAKYTSNEKRKKQIERDRRVSIETWGDGQAKLTVVGPITSIVGAYQRATDLARTMRAGGDERTIEQLRYDVFTGLAMFGQPVRESAEEDVIAFAESFDTAFPACPLPNAVVNVVVSAASLLGVNDEPGEIRKHAWLGAQAVRDLAYQQGATWRRIVTDPITGYAMSTTSKSYTPPQRMREAVKDRDGTCRFPGCTESADNADLDHVIEHPAGRTSGDNLQSLHRTHHHRKTKKMWRAKMTPEGVVTWTTPLGRKETTFPFDYNTAYGGPHKIGKTPWEEVDPGPPPF